MAFYSFFWPGPQGQDSQGELPLARKVSAAFCVISLAALLVMNMSYGGWIGGGTSGPRYISGVFLCFAFWIALELDRFPSILRKFFWFLLGIAVLFRAVVYGSTILGPGMPLWQWYLFSEYARPTWTPQLRFTIFALVLAGAWYAQRKLWRKQGTGA